MARRLPRPRAPAAVVALSAAAAAAAALAGAGARAAAWTLQAPAAGGRVRAPRRTLLARRAAAGDDGEVITLGEKRKGEPQPWDEDYPRPPLQVYEDDFDDEKIQAFYEETISGGGGPPPPGRVEDIITQYFMWDIDMGAGQPGGGRPWNRTHHELGFKTLKEQMRDRTWITYGGPKQVTPTDWKDWVWLAGEMTCVGLCLQIYISVPYGRRPLLVAKKDDVEGMFAKVNWAKFEERLDGPVLGTWLREEPRPPDGEGWQDKFPFSKDIGA